MVRSRRWWMKNFVLFYLEWLIGKELGLHNILYFFELFLFLHASVKHKLENCQKPHTFLTKQRKQGNQICYLMQSIVFLVVCILWGISPRRRTLVHYARGRSSYSYIFLIPIWRELLIWVEVPVLMGSPEVQEHTLGLTLSGGPPSRELTTFS